MILEVLFIAPKTISNSHLNTNCIINVNSKQNRNIKQTIHIYYLLYTNTQNKWILKEIYINNGKDVSLVVRYNNNNIMKIHFAMWKHACGINQGRNYYKSFYVFWH